MTKHMCMDNRENNVTEQCVRVWLCSHTSLMIKLSGGLVWTEWWTYSYVKHA